MLQQSTNPMEYAMHKPDQSFHVNKPFLLICLFTCSTLAASLMPAGDAVEADTGPAPMAREAGHATLPVCSTDALKLSAHCQPGRQA
ncbi:hypothetical protein IGS61_02860 [Janthinobacterium sp. FW305-129]|uniref:hypothetical protein n=1 Tax=Janthinobacterium sp. FW305-129 TaxID=2775054 RepID=UPI001E53360D|nr:hypothetical protein [Janthinobacterium sp. FW305-129]MCC7596410.1 hypothetical protein [Janthinobacterium sp. FW305-129]